LKIYLAPLQGVTDWIFREVYISHFGGIDKYFSPFIRIDKGQYYRPNQKKDILPENNELQKPIPQFLGKDIESFQLFEDLCHEHGYEEVNLNFGCPYPMVTNRGFGAGILEHPDVIEKFLNEIFASTKLKISIKSRLGKNSIGELMKLLPLIQNYPVEELIVHPRTADQMYTGTVHMEEFEKIADNSSLSICYNGDIKSKADIDAIGEKYPNVKSIMIGRGLLENPEMLSEAEDTAKLKDFHLKIAELCCKKYSGDAAILKRLVEMWTYHHKKYSADLKIFKKVKKCRNLNDYKAMLEYL